MDKQAAKTRDRALWAWVAIAAMLPCSSWGLGLGDITLTSYLNEPLAAEVELLDVQNLTADDIRVRLATQDAFDRLGVERAYFLTSINFEVIVEGGTGKILLKTSKPLLEPYLDFLVETRWPDGRLLREYTVLVDLPSSPVASEPAATLGKSAAAPEPSVTPTPEAEAPRFVTPETRPDRNYDRDAEMMPRTGGRYLVQSNDTLWEIATAAAPEGASIEQTMLATAQMNADAFTGGNINGLKAGYVLELPEERDILMSQREAFSAVAQANEDWRNGVRRAPALRVVADDEIPADDDVDDWQESTEATVFADEGDDEGDTAADVMAAGVEPDAFSDVGDVQDPLPSPSESVGSAPSGPSSSELMEIEARLTALSEQVGSLRELVVVKDQQIAALEAQLANQQASPAPTPSQAVAPRASTVEGGYPWWLFALGGVALLAIGAVVYTRRIQRPVMVLKRTAPPAELEPSVNRPNELEAAMAPVPADAARSGDGERGYGQRLHNDYVEENPVADAVAEADIYVAYGRYQQALNLLETAAKTNPDDPAAILKMVEIYLKNDRIDEARTAAQGLEGLGDGSAYGQASRMLSDAEERADAVDLGELAAPVDSPLSLDLDIAEQTLSSAPPVDLDLDLDLGQAKFDEMPASSAEDGQLTNGAQLANPAEEEIDLGAGMADLSEPASSPESLPAELAEVLGSDIPPPEADEEIEGEGLVYAQEVDPIDTQLDLARAYIDMGDEDGARPVLNDVIASGDLRQQAEARELLVSID